MAKRARWLSAQCALLCGLMIGTWSCNTFDDPSDGGSDFFAGPGFEPDEDRGPPPAAGFAGAPAPFAGSPARGGTGGGGFQPIDAGVVDDADSGSDDAGR